MDLTIGIFFDGTGNTIFDKHPDAISNIAKLYKVYGEGFSQTEKVYVRGVGSAKSSKDDDNFEAGRKPAAMLKQILGGAIGRGGEARILYAIGNIAALIEKHPSASVTLDVFGFSRGAALARDCVNRLSESPVHSNQCIRFLGLFDTVSSFGIPGDDRDGYFNFDVDNSKVKFIYHLTAQDELRQFFDLQSICSSAEQNLSESSVDQTKQRWMIEQNCIGVHADIGGGYRNRNKYGRSNDLSRLYLDKMYQQAIACNVPMGDKPEGAEYNFLWRYPDMLKSRVDYFDALAGDNPERLRYFILYRNQRLFYQITKAQYKSRVPRRGKAGRRNRHVKNEYFYVKRRLLPAVEKAFKKSFDFSEDAYRVFDNRYRTFFNELVHRSPNPFNSTNLGMAPQCYSVGDLHRCWPAAEFTQLDRESTVIYRDVFYQEGECI